MTATDEKTPESGDTVASTGRRMKMSVNLPMAFRPHWSTGRGLASLGGRTELLTAMGARGIPR